MMGVLGNLEHERFCQALHKRVWAGERRSTARTEAYRETMYTGDRPDDAAIAPNARRISNRKDIKARLAELSRYSSMLAGIDASWALVKLKRYTDFNVNDYLTPPNEAGLRLFNIGKVPPEKLELLSELMVEEFTEGKGAPAVGVRRTKIKGHDPIAVLGLMARIAGWEAPKKVAPTNAEGETLTLEQLVSVSFEIAKPPVAHTVPSGPTVEILGTGK
jgi:hypothetical protein